MSLRLTAKVRNDHLVSARKQRGWSQAELAARAGVGVSHVVALERRDYRGRRAGDRALRVAAALSLAVDSVMPEEMVGRRLEADRVSVAEVTPALLARSSAPERLICGPPDHEMELKDEVQRLLSFAAPRDREAVAAYFGVGGSPPMSLVEVGAAQEPPVSHNRVKQRIDRAIERIRACVGRQLDPATFRRTTASSSPLLMPRMRVATRTCWFGECGDVRIWIHRTRPSGRGPCRYNWRIVTDGCRCQGHAYKFKLAVRQARDAVESIRRSREAQAR